MHINITILEYSFVLVFSDLHLYYVRTSVFFITKMILLACTHKEFGPAMKEVKFWFLYRFYYLLLLKMET